jgi:hypothetical protein
MNLGRIIGLIVRVSALPLAFNAGLAIGMFLSRGALSYVLAALFVIASTGAVFLWVIKNVKASVIGFVQEGDHPLDTSENGPKKPPSMNTAADELALAARSHILFTLLAGYVLIAFVFALAYQAVEGTPADSFKANFYFSLTTLSTVGYGDISPRDFGRALACIEMISGVAYQVLAIGGGAAHLLELGKHNPRD